MRKLLRDWWRGYSDRDLITARAKYEAIGFPCEPGALRHCSDAELRCMLVFETEREAYRDGLRREITKRIDDLSRALGGAAC